LASSLQASESWPSLTALVPDDVGICVEIDGLSTRAQVLVDSPFYDWLQSVPPMAGWTSTDARRIEAMARALAPQLGLDANQLWSDLFGREVLFGVWPTGTGDRQQATGLLLTRGQSRERLDEFLRVLCDTSRMADVERVVERSHEGRPYFLRITRRPQGEQRAYLAAVGDIGVLTTSEAAVQRVLKLANSEAGRGSLAQSAVYSQALAQVAPRPMMRVFVNPRNWDHLIRMSIAEKSDPPSASVPRLIEDIWQATDGWMTSIDLDSSLRLESYMALDRTRLPGDAKKLVDSLTGPGRFLERVPDDAVMALAGRLDLTQLNRAMETSPGSAQTDQEDEADEPRSPGLGLFDHLLVDMGPNLCAFVRRTPLGPDGEMDVNWTMSLETRGALNEAAGSQRDATLQSALKTGLQLLVDLDNAQREGELVPGERAILESADVDGLRVSTIRRMTTLPVGNSASFCLVDGSLSLGSSPADVREVATRGPQTPLPQSKVFRDLLSPRWSDPSQALFVDCRALDDLMRTHSQEVSAAVAVLQGRNPASVWLDLRRLYELVQASERLLLAGKVDEQGIRISLNAVLRP
jgi:hypothetical protein